VKAEFKILTKKREGQSHRETLVTIDWSGISKEDLMILAKNALVQDLQARIQKEFQQFPTEYMIIAKDVVHKESAALWQYQPREPRQQPEFPESKSLRELHKLLDGLPKEELELLLSTP
jgi:hypothetical protein